MSPTALRSPTKTSTLKLSDVARHVVIPDGIVTTAWPRVVAQCAQMGVTFDEWQNGIGRIALGKRKDGKYAATVGGVVLSIPRQVGKTFLVGMIIIALCVIFPGLTVLWTAHRTRTTTKTFGTLKAMTSRKKIKPFMLDPRNTNGEQEIRFRNGSVIMFGAREQGFGRGFDEVDVEVFDEAQILTEKALEDMVPAANQSRQEAGALLFFMGTPPRPTDPGDEFTNRRTKALAGKAKNMVYVELSADQDADPDDHKQWGKANPSFPLRTPVESMERMRENLTDADSYRREALGIWDEFGDSGVISMFEWHRGGVEMLPGFANPSVALDLRAGLSQSFAISVAARVDDNTDLIDLAAYEVRGASTWSRDFVVAEVLTVLRSHGLDSVAVDAFGEGNGSIIPLLRDAGVNVVSLNTADMRSGSVGIKDAIENGRLIHEQNDILTAAVRAVGVRKSNEGFIFTQDKSSADITSLRAATAAWWVLQNNPVYDVSKSFL